jgi:hypothetical protein
MVSYVCIRGKTEHLTQPQGYDVRLNHLCREGIPFNYCVVCGQVVCGRCGNQAGGMWAHAGTVIMDLPGKSRPSRVERLCWRLRSLYRDYFMERGVPKEMGEPHIFPHGFYCENAPPPALYRQTLVFLDQPLAGKQIRTTLVQYPRDRLEWERHVRAHPGTRSEREVQPPRTPDRFGGMVAGYQHRIGHLRCDLCGGWIRQLPGVR